MTLNPFCQKIIAALYNNGSIVLILSFFQRRVEKDFQKSFIDLSVVDSMQNRAKMSWARIIKLDTYQNGLMLFVESIYRQET